MERTFDLSETEHGYTLINGNEKFVLNHSKTGALADWYLKQVAPAPEYITGLFYNKKSKLFRGKARHGQYIFVRMFGTVAKITGL